MHSERAEQDGGGVQSPDGLDELFGAFGVVAVDQHSAGAFLPYRIVDAFRSVDELRLVTVELHHQTEQRSDYLFARKNQNVTQ